TAPKFGPASLAGVLVMILVLFYGVRSVQQFRQAENAEAVFQQQTVERQKVDATESEDMQETDSPESATGGNMSGRAAEEEVSDMETVESGSYSEKKDTETDTEAVFKSTETGSVSGTTEADSTVGNYR